MANQIKSITLVLAVVIAFCFIYSSSLQKIADSGGEWMRRNSNRFCHQGYRLHSEHCLHAEGGQTYHLYVFETTDVLHGIEPGVQILLENDSHQELDRLNVNSEHVLFNTAILESVTPQRIELVFRVDGGRSDLYCYYWKVQGSRLVRADFIPA